MISNEMFREFIEADLRRFTEEIDNVIYHLDGPGELKHLDTILQFPKLKAVQWVPGAGAPDQSQWPEVYQKIHKAGKYIQVWDGYDCIRAVEQQIGTSAGIHQMSVTGNGRKEDREYHIRNLRDLGVIE